MPKGRGKKNKTNRKLARRGNNSTAVVAVKIRDPLGEENELDLGDLKVYPRMFVQPKLTNQTYRIQRWVTVSDVSQAAGADTFSTYQFQINDVSSTTDFSALFDQYRFVAVKCEFRPRFDTANLGSVAANKLGRLYSVLDYDDNTAPTLLTQLKEYQSCKITRFDQDHVRLLTPHMALGTLNQAGTFVARSNVPPRWIDLADLTVVHYGIKIGIEGGVGGQTNLQSWSIDFLYMLEFRQVR